MATQALFRQHRRSRSAGLEARPACTATSTPSLCEEGSIAGAAAREALVASAVSKRMAALEAQVGTPLLVRGRRGIAPTAAGQALLREARQVQQVMARLHAELSGFASGLTGSVRVVAGACAWAWPRW